MRDMKLVATLWAVCGIVVGTERAHGETGAPVPIPMNDAELMACKKYIAVGIAEIGQPCPKVAQINGEFVYDGNVSRWGNIGSMSTGTTYSNQSGTWGFRMYVCNAESSAACTMKNSVARLETNTHVYINANQRMSLGKIGSVDQVAVQGPVNWCFTYVGPDGRDYGNSVKQMRPGMMCSDAYLMPSMPGKCVINNGGSLEINLGSLTTAEIKKRRSGTTTTVSIPVTCDVSGGGKVKITFDYNPVTIQGGQVILSSMKGLGVALTYDGKHVAPSDVYYRTLQPGISNVELGFTVVAEKNTTLSAGNYNASATMILTEQ